MKIVNKTPVTLAVAGLLGTVGSAHAFTGGIGGGVPTFTENIFNDAADAFSQAGVQTLTVEATDTFLGRSTGFNVQIRLDTGVFTTANPGTMAVPTTATCQTLLDAGTAAPGTMGGTTGWICTVASGGAGSNVVTYSIVPAAGGAPGIVAGALLTFPGASFGVRNVHTTLGKDINGTVTEDVLLNDPVGGGNLATASNVGLATSVPGVNYGTAPPGNTAARIDVGSPNNKLVYSPNGVIGNTAPVPFFDAGNVTWTPAGVCNGFTPTGTTDVNCSTGNVFLFDGTADGGATNDTVSVTVAGTDFSAFDTNNTVAGVGVFLQTGACASASTGGAVAMTVGATQATVTTPILAAGGDTLNVCFIADGVTIIEAQPITVAAQVNFNDGRITAPDALGATAIQAMLYNGSTATLDMVNPGSNTIQAGFTRWCNTGPVAGDVSLAATDDTGTPAPGGNITFNLGSGACLQATSADLENGSTKFTGAFGDGTGKWQITGTLEASGLRGFSLIRTPEGTLHNVSNSTIDRNVGPDWDQDGLN